MTPRAGADRQFLSAAAVLILILVCFSTPQPWLRSAGMVLASLALLAWALAWTRTRTHLWLPRAAVPMLGYVSWCLLMVWRSPLPLAGLERAMAALALVVGFVVVSEGLREDWRSQAIEHAILAFAAAFVLLELTLWAIWLAQVWAAGGAWFSSPSIGYRATGLLLGHPNALAGFLCLAIPLASRHLLEGSPTRKRLGWGLLVLLLLAGLYLTSSRSGWVACLAGVAAMVLLSSYSRFRPRAREPRKLLTGIAGIAGAVLVVAAGMAYLFLQSERTPGHASLRSPRAGIWGPAVEMIAASPVLGQGVGAFATKFAEETGIPPGFATSHAHSLGLQILAETGMIGLILCGWLGLEVVRSLIRGWRLVVPPERLAFSAYLGALIAVVIHHLADFLFESTLYAAAVLCILALALRFERLGDRVRMSRAIARVGMAIVLAIYITGGILTQNGASTYWRGVALGRAGDWEAAAEHLCRAAEVQPRAPLYSFQCGLALARLGKPKNLETAVATYRQALEVDSAWPTHWANLAALEWATGERGDAVAHMRRASAAAPRDPEMAINLGLYLEATGDSAGAVAAYRRAIQSDPWLALGSGVEGSRAWKTALTNEADFLSEVASASPTYAAWMDQSPDSTAVLEGFREAVQREPLSALAHAGLALSEQEGGNSESAGQHMQLALGLGPFDPQVQHAAAVLARRSGNEDLARERLFQVVTLVSQPNQSTTFYTTAYLRYYLASDLVPQMARAEMTQAMQADLAELRDELVRAGEASKAREVELTLAQQAHFP